MDTSDCFSQRSFENSGKIKDLTSKTIHLEIAPGQQCYWYAAGYFMLDFSGNMRDFSVPEFQCSVCYRWFHSHCMTFDIGYV